MSAFPFSRVFLQEVQERLSELSDLAPGEQGVFELVFSGVADGIWTIDTTVEPPRVSKGSTGRADVSVEMAAQDFIDVYEGKTSGLSAFLGGKIRVKGDRPLAMRLGGLLNKIF